MDQLIADRYALGPLIGRGGMGQVYSATDRRLGRPVAVKLVPVTHADPTARQRFVREARSGAGFSHPNSVAIFDAGEANGFLFLVMELVAGRSLAERLAAQGPLDPRAAAHVAVGMLRALGAAHAVGIVHRDVKPANVLLADDGRVKLADFGIAKRLDDVAGEVTMAGQIVGTPKYLAPEQVSGQPATAASDLYAVGVVLYEMLAGRAPFEAETPLATALAHRESPVPDIDAVQTAVPPQLASAIRTAMAKQPADRYQSAAAMLAAIEPGTAVYPSVPAPARPAAHPTRVMPAAGYARPSVPRGWLALVALLVAGAGVLALVVVVGGDESEQARPGPVSTSAPAVSAADAATAPAATAPAATAPTSPSMATTVVAPTTSPPVASARPVAPAAAATDPPVPDDAAGQGIPAASELDTIDGLADALAVDPDQFGPRTVDVIEQLGDINGNGRAAQRQAASLLENAAGWVESGELSPAVLVMVEPLLLPLIERGGGDGNGNGDDEDDDEDDGDD